MCKSKAEGGQRCFSHANAEYIDTKKKYEAKERELHSSRLLLQNVKNTIERLDIAQELGQVSDEDYNRYLDTFVTQREAALKEVHANEKAVESLSADVTRTLHEVRTTQTGLANLKAEIHAETDPVKRHRLQFEYNSCSRLRKVRQQAFERFQARQEKSKELAAKANEKMKAAQELPEYDYQTREIKAEAILEAEHLSARAYLESTNGREVFPALFDKEGNVVPAKIVKTKHGRAWGILSDPKNPSSKFKPGQFVTISQSKDPKKREEFYASKGYTVGKVWAEAEAKILTDDNGVKKVSILRNDGGYSPFAETVTTNQYKTD
jgi:hypothetical protein